MFLSTVYMNICYCALTNKSRVNSVNRTSGWTIESTGITLRLILNEYFTTIWETWKIWKKVNYSFENGYNYIVLGIKMNSEKGEHVMACPFSLNKNSYLVYVHCRAINLLWTGHTSQILFKNIQYVDR